MDNDQYIGTHYPRTKPFYSLFINMWSEVEGLFINMSSEVEGSSEFTGNRVGFVMTGKKNIELKVAKYLSTIGDN